MRKIILFFLLFFCSFVWGQDYFLKIDGGVDGRVILKDLRFVERHKNVKLVVEQANEVLKSVQKMGFLESRFREPMRVNDSTFLFALDFGRQTKFARIYIGKENCSVIGFEKEVFDVRIGDVEGFVEDVVGRLESKGFMLAKVRLDVRKVSNDTLFGDVVIDLEKKRLMNLVVVNGMPKFPVGFKRQLERMYRSKTLNKSNLDKLSASVDQFGFVNQIKYPEVLFGTEKTEVYVYVEKSKSNSFDGFLGFSSNATSGLELNGYLDLNLQNILNTGEKMALYWKSNGDGQRDFNLGIELPFVFDSPIGVQGLLRIFRQDSTFQNTRTNFGLGYYFTAESKLFLGYESTESSDIQNINNNLLNDFTSSFFTAEFSFIKQKKLFSEFRESNYLSLKVGSGNRIGKSETTSQFYGNLSGQYNWQLNEKNFIRFKSAHYYLQSNQYVTNELHRFGGINSIRGFTENSLQGNLFSSIATEYRYYASSSLYVHSIMDYGYFNDPTTGLSERIIGLGVGLGVATKNGVFNLVYANGSFQNDAIQLRNSLVQISLKTRF